MKTLFVFGLGYTARVFAHRRQAATWRIVGTVRSRERSEMLRTEGIEALVFDGTVRDAAVAREIRKASHLLASIPPGSDGDPALLHHGADIRAAAGLRWIGYLSTIGVYGDRQGGWADEETEPAWTPRTFRRLEAEQGWRALGREIAVPSHVFRLGGIYGRGRNVLRAVRNGSARQVIKPGQVFNRIHVDDIATVLEASIDHPRQGRVYNVVDDEPAPPQDVILEAAHLLGSEAPPAVSFESAALSPKAQAFYSASRRIANRRIKEELGVRLSFPTYRQGLRALLHDP